METDFQKTVDQYTIGEAIEQASYSCLPWAHKLATEVLSLQLQIKQLKIGELSSEECEREWGLDV